MNSAHLHLLLNHFPTVGTIVALALLLAAISRKNDDLTLASLAAFFIIGLLTIPTYLSGNLSQQIIANQPGVSEALITRHQDAAVLAFAFMMVTGAVAWLGLWQFRRQSRTARWMPPTLLVLAVVTVFLMVDAASMGGEIRHPEIQSGPPMTIELVPGLAAKAAGWVIAHPWAWPALETFHFIGLALLLSVVLLVNLRLLGMIKKISFAALHGLLPWGIVGFGINTASGMLFFMAAPDQYTQNPAFYWKIFFVLLAGANLLYLTVFDETWAVGAGDEAPMRAKITAASALFVWFGVIFWGRLMPFLGLTF